MVTLQQRSRPLSKAELAQFHRREWQGKNGRLPIFVHNLVPVLGVVVLGWSSSLTLFSLWLDGIVALGLSIALLISRAAAGIGGASAMARRLQLLVLWLILLAVLGAPYLVALALGWDQLASDAVRGAISSSSVNLAILAAMLLANILALRDLWRRALRSVRRTSAPLIARDLVVHLVRGLALLLLVYVSINPSILTLAVVLISAVTIYLELFPNSLLMAAVGHPQPDTPWHRWKQEADLDALFQPREGS